MKYLTFKDQELVQLIESGAIGILPTDTIYGIHASAFSKDSIEEMYKIRLRDSNKPFIVLLSDIRDLNKFDIYINESQRKMLNDIWKESVSIIIPVQDKFEYLTRNTGSIAFRIPKYDALKSLLKVTGPLVSTSVNKQGEPPAATIKEAENIFGDVLSFAVDVGEIKSDPSTVVKLLNDKVEFVRQGKGKVPSEYLI